MAKWLKTVRINRAKWGEGSLVCEGLTSDDQWTPKGSMCCMGHYGKACGLTQKQMLGSYYLAQVSDKPIDNPLFSPFLDGSSLAIKLADANDDNHLTLAEKEKKIKQIAAEARINFIFYGKHSKRRLAMNKYRLEAQL